MNIEKYQSPVARMEWHGSTPIPTSALTQDLAGATTNGKGFNREAGATNKTLFTNTYENTRVNTVQPVLMNIDGAKPTIVNLPNKYTDPAKKFGTNN
tara:strand:+ start:408 stop:698 length:291 start_codon:yes stop_codon:yes gene_type:complete